MQSRQLVRNGPIVRVELSSADLERIDAVVPRPVGDRCDETGMRSLNR